MLSFANRFAIRRRAIRYYYLDTLPLCFMMMLRALLLLLRYAAYAFVSPR